MEGTVLRKRAAYSLAMPSIILILSATVIANASAADYTKMGVRVSDTAIYETSITSQPFNKTVLTVTDVNGTIVTIDLIYHNPNGSTYDTFTLRADVSTGEDFVTL